MTRALSHVSQQNYHLVANANFSFLFISYFQVDYIFLSMVSLPEWIPNHTNWKRTYILDFGRWRPGEVHSIWVLWTRRPSRMQGQLLFEVWWGNPRFLVGFQKNSRGLHEGCGLWARALLLAETLLLKIIKGGLASTLHTYYHAIFWSTLRIRSTTCSWGKIIPLMASKISQLTLLKCHMVRSRHP